MPSYSQARNDSVNRKSTLRAANPLAKALQLYGRDAIPE